jgi:hypothetical protein
LALVGLVAVAILIVAVVALIQLGGHAGPDAAKGAMDAEAAGAALVWCGILCGLLVLCLAYVVGLILLLAWVAGDCRNRNMDGGAVWILVILSLHWVGLLVYLASRPHGMLTICTTCGNKRLVHARVCPHCGHS